MDAQRNITNPIIANLCNRYASGRVTGMNNELRKIQRSESIEKASSIKRESVEIKEEDIKKFRSGNGYMTSDDFAALFRARRNNMSVAHIERTSDSALAKNEIISKNPNSSDEATQNMSNAESYDDYLENDKTELVSDKYGNPSDCEASIDDYNTYARRNCSSEKAVSLNKRKMYKGGIIKRVKCFILFILENIKEWVEYDPKELRAKKKKKQFPVIAFAAVIVMALSLFLIVRSSVMLMNADRDIAELKSDINSIKEEEALLDSRLEEKINLGEIEKIASEELGMIKSEYITIKYISYGDQNAVKIYNTDETERELPIIGTLLSALGFGK